MRRPSSVVAFGRHLFVGFILLSLFIGTLGTEKKETKTVAAAAAHVPADAKHPPPVAAHAAAGTGHATDPKHASPSPAGAAASHAHPPNGGAAHAAEPKHAAAPAIKITDEANNVYSVCVERDVLPAPDNSPKDKLKAIAAKCDECGAAKCKAKCGGKEVNDACRTCIMQNCPPAK
ncbi:hypothetical protein niasHT_034496 [Heterodera trifolii]|uniref:Effector protein n=1 Tax=Heterodera trifolii TaxID=157864 RepID=A0ABD2HW77_9BILA